ncbi:MAG: lysine biosynthesis protein LysW [bacterium]|nr:lysine biosynthesis protein LysW [bacterium]
MEKTVKCPDCQAEVKIPNEAPVGEILECLNCGAEMELISLDPLEVSLIEEEK